MRIWLVIFINSILISSLTAHIYAFTDYENRCGSVIAGSFGNDDCKTTSGTQAPIGGGATICSDNPQRCCITDSQIVDASSCLSVPTPIPQPGDPIVPVKPIVIECGSRMTTAANTRPTAQCGCPDPVDWFLFTNRGSSLDWCCGLLDNGRCVNTDTPSDPIPPAQGVGGSGCGIIQKNSLGKNACVLNASTSLAEGTYELCDGGKFCCGGGATCPEIIIEPGDGGEEDTGPSLNIFEGPGKNDFDLLNPLKMFDSPYADKFSSPAGIINRALRFAFPLAGLILFVMIVWGGFEILSGATNTKGVQAGKQRITAALLGFGLLFISFWIIQIVEYIFNLAIL